MRNIARKLAAAVLAAAALAGMAVNAGAVSQTVYTAAAGTETEIMKYLVMDEDANVPNVTFSYTIEPGSARSYDLEGGTVEVLPGPAGAVIGTAQFSAGDTTYDTVQSNVIAGNDGSTGFDDVLTLEEGEKYAREAVTADFSACSFTEPGIYRYIVTETASESAGITDDENAVRCLDVYVTDQEGSLTVSGYVLHADTDTVAMSADYGSDGENPETKPMGYTNRYVTHDLSFSKAVSGNQASKDKFFEFTLNMTGAVPGTRYTVDLTAAVAEPAATDSTSVRVAANPAELTAGADGTVTQKFYLQHGQSITVCGLADGTEYTLSEEAEDYKPSVLVTTEDSEYTVAETKDRVTDSAIGADTSVDFTNTRDGIIPTGVILSAAPYAGLVLLGGAGAGAMLIRRKKKDEDSEA